MASGGSVLQKPEPFEMVGAGLIRDVGQPLAIRGDTTVAFGRGTIQHQDELFSRPVDPYISVGSVLLTLYLQHIAFTGNHLV
jgi:hypothetical protein